MKNKFKLVLLSGLVLSLNLVSCDTDNNDSSDISSSVESDTSFHFKEESKTLYIGEQYRTHLVNASGKILYQVDSNSVSVDENGVVLALQEGTALLTATDENGNTDSMRIEVVKNENPLVNVTVFDSKVEVGEHAVFLLGFSSKVPEEERNNYRIVILSGANLVEVDENMQGFTCLAPGVVHFVFSNGIHVSEDVSVEIVQYSYKGVTIQSFVVTSSSGDYSLRKGETIELTGSVDGISIADSSLNYKLVKGGEAASIDSNGILSLKDTINQVTDIEVEVTYKNSVSQTVEIVGYPSDLIEPNSISISSEKDTFNINEELPVKVSFASSLASEDGLYKDYYFEVTSNPQAVRITSNGLVGIKIAQIKVVAKLGNLTSNELTLEVTSREDPYLNVDEDEFYQDYYMASTYEDAVYRTRHYLMSGDTSPQDQAPTISSSQPKDNGKLMRNTSLTYSDYDENGDPIAYTVVDEVGDPIYTIFKDAAYTTLQDVAAYVFAFNDIPANYIQGKHGNPSTNPWHKWLRCNQSNFSGSTTSYPYEPALPDISGIGGDLHYYEIDIGTTGTSTDPSYMPHEYNDGKNIDRGAARIVYASYRKYDDELSPNERYVFYTYNHYNDFQEYLNYYNGWGEMFGNITGGGEMSSHENYNPTPYPEVVYSDFRN